MERNRARFTVYFEDPFWVGIYEREEDGRYSVCKITFGAEPADCEVYEFLLKSWSRLTFSPSIPGEMPPERRMNPKRMQRAIHTQTRQQGIGTKAQQALKLQQEQGKQARKAASKEQREQEEARRFALRQAKRKAKRNGH